MITNEDHGVIATEIQNIRKKLDALDPTSAQLRLARLAVMLAAIFAGEDDCFDVAQFCDDCGVATL
jgi:hypothetical protein